MFAYMFCRSLNYAIDRRGSLKHFCCKSLVEHLFSFNQHFSPKMGVRDSVPVRDRCGSAQLHHDSSLRSLLPLSYLCSLVEAKCGQKTGCHGIRIPWNEQHKMLQIPLVVVVRAGMKDSVHISQSGVGM